MININQPMIEKIRNIDMNLIREATLQEMKQSIRKLINNAKSKEELKVMLINMGYNLELRESGGRR